MDLGVRINLLKKHMLKKIKTRYSRKENYIFEPHMDFLNAKDVIQQSETHLGENTKYVKSAKKKRDTLVDINQGEKLSEIKNATYAVKILKVTAHELDSALKNVPTQGRCLDKDSVEDVYNLHVEGANEYFANGVLVHNCDAMSMSLQFLDNTPAGMEAKQSRPKWVGYGKRG